MIARVDSNAIEFLDSLDSASRHSFTPCADGRMIWRIWGAGPPLVLLHGGYGSWRHWCRNIPAMSKSRTLYVPDLPGLGDSANAPAPQTPAIIAEVVSNGLGVLGLQDESLDLVGFSFGAMISGLVAARHPSLRSLTLVGAGALGVARSDIVLVKQDSEAVNMDKRMVARLNLERLMIADPALVDGLAVTIQEENVRRARVKSRRFAQSDLLAAALRKSCPHRLNTIWGSADAVSAPFLAERKSLLQSIRSDVSFSVIEGAGHWVQYEAADRFNPLLQELLAADFEK